MIHQLKKAIKKYDDWCQSMGLTPDQKRCCVPVRKEDLFDDKEKKDGKGTDKTL